MKVPVAIRRLAASTLLFLIVGSAFCSVGSVFLTSWAEDADSKILKMYAQEQVIVEENGDAQLIVNTVAPNSPLADRYRDNLAAPSDTEVGTEIPIPETRKSTGNLSQNLIQNSLPVREEFYRSVRQEQKYSFGFTTQILNSSMMPQDSDGGFRYSFSAVATPQVLNVTANGADGIWTLFIGQKDEDAKKTVIGYEMTEIMFAKMLLDSIQGVDTYTIVWTTEIRLPIGATLLNSDELSGLHWVLDFGGGTYMSADVAVSDSTVILTDRTTVSNSNITAPDSDLFNNFCNYRNLRITYLLPNSASLGLERMQSGDFQRDSHFDFSIGMGFSITTTLINDNGLQVDLTLTPSVTFSGYVGWDFSGLLLQWFRAWFGADAELKIRLDFYVHFPAFTCDWDASWTYRLAILYFEIATIPIEAGLDLHMKPYVHLEMNGELDFYFEYIIGYYFKSGIQWDIKDGWSPIAEFSSYSSHTWGANEIKLYLEADAGVEFDLSLMFFESVGPWVGFEPYVHALINYYSADDPDLAVWSVDLGFRIHAGLAIAGWLEYLLGIESTSYTLKDEVIKSWKGKFGLANTRTTLQLPNYAIMTGSGTYLAGSVTCNFLNSHSDYSSWFNLIQGRIVLEYSLDGGGTWQPIGTPYLQGAAFSYWWVPASDGNYTVRATYSGNGEYKASNGTVNLRVAPDVPGIQEFDSTEPAGGVPNEYWREPTDPHAAIIGWAAEFYNPPVQGFKVEQIGFPAYYTGDGTRQFLVEIWYLNSTSGGINVLYRATHRYGEFFTTTPPGPPDYLSYINVGQIEAPGSYWVCIFPNSSDTDQLRVGVYDIKSPIFTLYNARIWFTYPEYIRSIINSTSMYLPIIHIRGETMAGSHHIFGQVGSNFVYSPDPTLFTNYDRVWTNTSITPSFAAFAKTIRYIWRDPDGNAFCTNDYVVPVNWNGLWNDSISISTYGSLIEQHLGGIFQVEVYVIDLKGFVQYVTTDNFRVIKHQVTILFGTNPTNPIINFGQSILLGAGLVPSSIVTGTIYLQYSIDNVTWTDIDSATPNRTYFVREWTPPSAGNFSVRAYWSGDPIYSNGTSETQTVIVNKADPSLSLSVSSDVVEAATDIKMTATIGPALQNRPVIFQYSLDGSTWFTVGILNVSSTGVYDYNWTVPEILYTGRIIDSGQFSGNITTPQLDLGNGGVLSGFFARSKWLGDDDYNNVTSDVHYVSVTMPAPLQAVGAELKLSPSAINPRTTDTLIAAYIKIPDGNGVTNLNASAIDIRSICLNDTVSTLLNGTLYPYDFAMPVYNESENNLKVYFNRTLVEQYVLNATGKTYGRNTFNITGTLVGGTPFAGNVTLTISKITGDTNGDGVVDIYDAIILAAAFLSTPTSPKWNPNADLNADGTVDIFDAILLAGHYNQHYP